jgi:hypothetical protein
VWAATNHYRVRHRLAVAPVAFRTISRPLLRPTSLPLLHPDRETTDELDRALVDYRRHRNARSGQLLDTADRHRNTFVPPGAL